MKKPQGKTHRGHKTARRALPSLPRLLALVRAARENAYAPYSRFKVGALAVAADGRVFPGVNVENLSYGVTICAERSALVSAVSAGVRKFACVVVIADTPGPVTPCGACRQFIAEFGLDIEVIMANLKGKVQRAKISELLPAAFAF